MSRNYDNWGKLVGAVLRREKDRQLAYCESFSSSSSADLSSRFSFDGDVHECAEHWMSHRKLPDDLKARIRRYEQYKWQENRGVEEESLIGNLPHDLRRDVKRHLCWTLLTRVPMFDKMDEQLLDALCSRLKPVLYTADSIIVREGDPVVDMLFIMRGNLLTTTTNGGRTGFFNAVGLMVGDFCGEELLTWALDPISSSSLPISTRTVRAVKDVEAFCLMPEDLKSVASQFRRLHSKQLQQTFRFYSQQWRTWGACFIQAAWRRYWRRQIQRELKEAEEGRLQGAMLHTPSIAAAVYASRFARNMMGQQAFRFYSQQWRTWGRALYRRRGGGIAGGRLRGS